MSLRKNIWAFAALGTEGVTAVMGNGLKKSVLLEVHYQSDFFSLHRKVKYLVIGTLLVKVVDTYVEYAKLSAWKIGVTGVGATGVA